MNYFLSHSGRLAARSKRRLCLCDTFASVTIRGGCERTVRNVAVLSVKILIAIGTG